MLRALTIQHFAIVEQAELELGAGFGVITGETGAGKSILVDALGLIVGGRAEGSLVAHGQDKAEIHAEFYPPPQSQAHAWLEANDLAEPDGSVLIRRSIQSTGGSRAWINAQPASASQLKELGTHLLEIHGQHAHQKLSKSEHQRALLDGQCPKAVLKTHAAAFRQWQDAKAKLDAFNDEVGDGTNAELLAFQATELKDLGLASGEYEALEAEQERLQHHDEIQLAIAKAAVLIDQDDAPCVRSLLRQAAQALSPVATIESRLGNVVNLIDESLIQISEAASELDHLATGSDEDPQQLVAINERLSHALDLARKHRIRPDELPALTQSLVERLGRLEDQDAHRQQLETAIRQAQEAWLTAAKALSKARQSAADELGRGALQALAQLGMGHAELAIEVRSDETIGPNALGIDEIKMLFSANPGQPLQSLSKVASGGELSRIALAIMLAAGGHATPLTRIFDEVDAGIGGETAHAIGAFLQRVGHSEDENAQALCVTHLAQVAARADQHFQVAKSQTQATSVTVKCLSPEERVEEIARMLGNARSEKSQAHARELLETSAS